MQKKLEKIIDRLKQVNLNFFAKESLCISLVERLETSPETLEDNVKWLLSLHLSPDIINNFFCIAIKKGHLAFVTLLATQGSLEQATSKNELICGAAEKGHLAVVKYLMTLPGVDLTANDNDAIRLAAQNGHLDMVKYLMTLPGVDPTVKDNDAIRVAAKNGHLDMVKYLMTLPGVDPAAQDNYAIRWAAYNGYVDVVQYLMTLPGVDPAAQDNDAICMAACNGHLDMVQYLMTLPGVDPRVQNNFAIRWAYENQHEEILAVLARAYYNPYEKGIALNEQEDRRNLLNNLFQEVKLIKLLLLMFEEANPKFTYLLGKDSFFGRDIGGLITEIGIKHGLQTALKPN